MQVLDCRNDFSHVLNCLSLTQFTFFLDQLIKLTFSTELKNQIEIIIIFKVIVEFDDMFMIELIHDLDFKFDLFYQIILNDLRFVNDFDSIHILRFLMPHFINLSKSSYTNV